MFENTHLEKVRPGLFLLVNAAGEPLAEIEAPSRPQAMRAAQEWMAREAAGEDGGLFAMAA